MIPTRRFGRTELPMPVLTCGGMRFQHRWDEEPPKPIPAENQDNLKKPSIAHLNWEFAILKRRADMEPRKLNSPPF